MYFPILRISGQYLPPEIHLQVKAQNGTTNAVNPLPSRNATPAAGIVAKY
jgi:hypothetical protein